MPLPVEAQKSRNADIASVAMAWCILTSLPLLKIHFQMFGDFSNEGCLATFLAVFYGGAQMVLAGAVFGLLRASSRFKRYAWGVLWGGVAFSVGYYGVWCVRVALIP